MQLTNALTRTLPRFTEPWLHRLFITYAGTVWFITGVTFTPCVIMQRAEYITQHFHSSFWACVNHLNLPRDTVSPHILPVKIQWSYVGPYCSSSLPHRWTLEQDSGWLGPPVRMWWTLNYLADRRYSPPVRSRGLCLAPTPFSCRCAPFSNEADPIRILLLPACLRYCCFVSSRVPLLRSSSCSLLKMASWQGIRSLTLKHRQTELLPHPYILSLSHMRKCV